MNVTKYVLILLFFAGACSNGKIVVDNIKTTEDKSSKEAIFNDFLVALRDNDFSKMQPLMVKSDEYADYLQTLTAQKVDTNKLGGSIADIYKFHLSQTERSFNRVRQQINKNNIDWNNAVITNLTWENEGDGQGQNARFTIKDKNNDNQCSILAKGMSQINGSWRIGNTFLVNKQ